MKKKRIRKADIRPPSTHVYPRRDVPREATPVYDVMATASRLAPRSARIAALLTMMQRDVARGRRIAPEPELASAVEAVMASMGVDENGEFIRLKPHCGPEPRTIEEAIRWMQRGRYVYCPTHIKQIFGANSLGMFAPLRRWADKFVEVVGSRFHIPIYARRMMVTKADHQRAYVTGQTDDEFGSQPDHFGFGVEIVHSLVDELPGRCWDVLHEIGEGLCKEFGLSLYHSLRLPEHWHVVDWESYRDQIRDPAIYPDRWDDSNNYSRSPAGERDALRKYYANNAPEPSPFDGPVGVDWRALGWKDRHTPPEDSERFMPGMPLRLIGDEPDWRAITRESLSRLRNNDDES